MSSRSVFYSLAIWLRICEAVTGDLFVLEDDMMNLDELRLKSASRVEVTFDFGMLT